MKIAFDIGGVLSKYPTQFRSMIFAFLNDPYCTFEIYIITDMHDRELTLKQLADNGFDFILPSRVYNADYATYGEMCKAVLLKKLGIDILVDDFPGYMTWDHRLGPAPIRLQIQPDPYRPYWSKDWVTNPDDGEFGRRVCPPFEELVRKFETEREDNGTAAEEV